MINRRLAVALFLVTFGPWFAATVLPAADQQEVDALVESIGQSVIDQGNVVGLSIGVARDDAVLCTRGFGLANVELNVPASADTVYRIGSITKEFTAAAILLLVQDGELGLDDPLSRHLTDYPKPGNRATIRQLLQHTSGIKDFTRLPNFRRERSLDVTPAEVLQRFQNLPLDFQPAQQFQYCNSGYFLLGLVIEKVSGKSYREFLTERIFEPIGLTNTYCASAPRIIAGRAAGYAVWSGVQRNAQAICMKQTVGAGNLASTVGDLLTWQQALVTARVIGSKSTDLMTNRGKLDNGKSINYGLGVFIRNMNGQKVVRHGGGIVGFRSEVAHYAPSGYTIAVLSNTENTNTTRIADRIARRLISDETSDTSDE